MLVNQASYLSPISSSATVIFCPLGVAIEYSWIGCEPTGSSLTVRAPADGLFNLAVRGMRSRNTFIRIRRKVAVWGRFRCGNEVRFGAGFEWQVGVKYREGGIRISGVLKFWRCCFVDVNIVCYTNSKYTIHVCTKPTKKNVQLTQSKHMQFQLQKPSIGNLIDRRSSSIIQLSLPYSMAVVFRSAVQAAWGASCSRKCQKKILPKMFLHCRA